MGRQKLSVYRYMKQTYDYIEDYLEENMAAGLILVAVLIGLILWCSKKPNNKRSHRAVPSAPPNEESYQKLYPDLHGDVSSSQYIPDRFSSLAQVTEALHRAGLESCNLIFGIDYTASNNYQGKHTFNGKCLHSIGPVSNPYQQVISIIGETLQEFDDDGIIPVFGFGDAKTKDRGVFPFKPEGYCNGFADVLQTYSQITPFVTLNGPTSFVPLIRQAIDIVRYSKAYHILIIIADGQVTSERPTRDAIVEASNWPLSIIMVGVGDGPWDEMKEFDDNIPSRRFDNFQFVNFHHIMATSSNKEAAFAMNALMEVPDQFKAVRKLGLLDI